MADSSLASLNALGSLLGIKTAPVVGRLMPLVGAWQGPLIATIPHTFRGISVTANLARDAALAVFPQLEPLAGDRIGLELGATTTVAHSEDAALPPTAPAVDVLGDDLASVSFDGEAWTFMLAQPNADDAAVAATIARLDEVAGTLGATPAQRKISASLHRSLARGMESWVWLRARGGELDPVIGVRWQQVEWLPIQHMMNGFYPELDAAAKLGRLSRNLGVEMATVELLLGPVDPPAMRILCALP